MEPETPEQVIEKLKEFAISHPRIKALCEGYDPRDSKKSKVYYFLTGNHQYDDRFEG